MQVTSEQILSLLEIAQDIVDDKSAWESYHDLYETFDCSFCYRSLRSRRDNVECSGHTEDCPIHRLSNLLETLEVTHDNHDTIE